MVNDVQDITTVLLYKLWSVDLRSECMKPCKVGLKNTESFQSGFTYTEKDVNTEQQQKLHL